MAVLVKRRCSRWCARSYVWTRYPNRLTLRMPESLKERVESAAAREGISTNSWLVRTISQGLERRPKFGNRITGYNEI